MKHRIWMIAVAAATLASQRPLHAAPSGYWCMLLDSDRNNSVCAKPRDACERGKDVARQLGSVPGECTHYDSAWMTHYKMGKLDIDWFYVSKDQCEAMRNLFEGTVCKEKH